MSRDAFGVDERGHRFNANQPHPTRLEAEDQESEVNRTIEAFPVYLLKVGAVASVYFAAAKLGFAGSVASGVVSTVWAPTGIALGALLLFGSRLWPGIALGAFLANATSGVSVLTAFPIALGNTLEALSAVFLLRIAGFQVKLDRVRDVLALVVLGAIVSTAVSATIGVASLWLGDAVPAGGPAFTWREWWSGDAIGSLLLVPLFLAWRHAAPIKLSFWRLAEAAALLGGLIVVGKTILFDGRLSYSYVIFPLLVWAVLRFRQRGATVASVVLFGFAVWATISGSDPFGGETTIESLQLVQMWVSVAATGMLIVAATIAERESVEEALRKEGKTVRLMQEIAQASNGAASVEDAIQGALDKVCAFARWPIGHAYLPDDDGVLVSAGIWHLEDQEHFGALHDISEHVVFSSGVGLPGRVAQKGTPAWIRDVTKEPNFSPAGLEPEWNIKGAFAFPVLVGEEVAAVLEFFTEEASPPEEALLETMTAVGTELGRVVERARADKDLEEQDRRTHAIIDSATDAFVATDASGVITDWNHQAEVTFGWTRDEIIGRRVGQTIVPPSLRARHEEDLARVAAQARGRILGNWIEFRGLHRSGREFPMELTQWQLQPGSQHDSFALMHDITERKLAEQRLGYEATHDSLTGLPNRVLFLDRLNLALARTRRDRRGIAVLLLDLDRFKWVNDSLGHDAGDQLLVGVGNRLHELIRPSDSIAHFGGNEFAMLCENVAGQDFAVGVAERVLQSLRAPISVGGRDVLITASVGIVMSDDPDAEPGTLLRHADTAMYRAKERGKARYELFDEVMRVSVARALETEQELRQALQEEELRVSYQPIISLDGGDVVSLEALTRWQHPQRGLILPIEFIPLAEETGLILQLGEWVLFEACRRAAQWNEGRFEGERPGVSVNISANQLSSPNLLEMVDRAIRESGIAPSSLLLEITETAMMKDLAESESVLNSLKGLGVSICIDDFGTGYSSLSCLRRFPIDLLKIDQSFVFSMDRDDESSSIIAMIISLAHALTIPAVAEGVETEEQLTMLRALECDLVQGYLFSEAVVADDVDKILLDATW